MLRTAKNVWMYLFVSARQTHLVSVRVVSLLPLNASVEFEGRTVEDPIVVGVLSRHAHSDAIDERYCISGQKVLFAFSNFLQKSFTLKRWDGADL